MRALASAVLLVCACQQPVRVRLPPPAPRTEVPPRRPSPQHVWQPGAWSWNRASGTWHWRAGQWVVKPPRARAWRPGRWEQRGIYWVWVPGRWVE